MAHNLQISTYGQGLPIVLLHGWGLNSGVWQPIAELLKEQYQVITVDLPGFGLNHDYVVEPYSLENISEKIVNVVSQPAIYLGWSLGGLIASTIALNHPSSCLGLVTVASSPCFKQQEGWPGIKPDYLSAFYHQLSKDIKQTLNNFLKIQAMGSPHIRQDLKHIQQLIMEYPLPDAVALKSGLDLLDGSDLRSELSRIEMPFLRLYGKLDSLVPMTTAALVDELSSQSDCVIIDKASHAPFISHQQTFINELGKWINTHY